MSKYRSNRYGYGLRAVLLAGVTLATVGLLVFAGTGAAASQAVPTNNSPPAFSGTEQDGHELSATTGTWSDDPTSFDYQWQRCNANGSGCANISGATSQQYTLGSADVGNRVRVGVRATNSSGTSDWSYSGNSGVIGAAGSAPVNASPPTISGTPRDNETLTASAGSWSGTQPITYTYDWLRCDSGGSGCASIGSPGQTFGVTSNEVGHRLRVTVTATNSAGSSSATSGSTDVVTAAGAGPVNTSAPTISGAPQDNQTLTADAGKWSGSTPISYSYQWRRCDTNGNNCTNLGGGKTYKVTSNDVGHRLRVVVTATNGVGSRTATSAATAVATAAGTAPKNTAIPVISGTARDNSTLSATAGTWTGSAPISYGFQWYRCDGNGSGCVAIPGATGASYRVSSADVGHRLRVTVVGRNAGGSAWATSAATPVAASASGSVPTGAAIAVSSVSLPNRLVIAKVKFSPPTIQSRNEQVIGRFRVVDSSGRPVSGALVYAIGVPANRVSAPPETRTDQTGWATLAYQPLRALPLRRGALLTIFVRARKPGESILAGVSTRRLVSIRVSP